MEEEIWSRLPFELVMVVLAFLPYRSLVRFQSVCKLWNALPSTASFQQLCQRLPLLHEDSYLLSIRRCPHVCMLYTPTTRRWHKIGLKLPKDNVVHSTVGAADGGLLLCTSEKGDADLSWIVFNPLLHSSRQLPALPLANSRLLWDVDMVQLIVDRRSKTYKVIAISRDHTGLHCRTHIYDSICERWTETGKMPACERFWSCTVCVICGPTLFALFCGPSDDDYTVMAYDIGAGVWTRVAIQMPFCCVVPTFVESEGRLLLVGLLGFLHDRDDRLLVAIWEFKVSTKTAEWVEIARMEIATRATMYQYFHVVSHDNLIVIWAGIPTPEVVMYDMKQHTWASPVLLEPPGLPARTEKCESTWCGFGWRF